MKRVSLMFAALMILLGLGTSPARAVDDTAANLVAQGKISLSKMIDELNRKYPKDREFFWNVSGIAYHDFTGIPQTDVIVGLSGYRDKGLVYNNEKQLVEDAGAGFAYFHLDKEEWKLIQVEVVEGKKYEGFEGTDLTGAKVDQLALYSSTGDKQMTSIYVLQKNGIFSKMTTIVGYGLGPRVAQQGGKVHIVDYQRALVSDCDECGIYYGRPYEWNGKGFVEQSDEFLDHVHSCDLAHSTDTQLTQSLAFFEGYLGSHPGDFCALANCYDVSVRLGLKDKADGYKRSLAKAGLESLACKYCDDWTMDHNKANGEEYLNLILEKKNHKKE